MFPWLDEVKNFLKLDHDTDDQLVEMLTMAAVGYLKNAGVTQDTDNEALYKLAVMLHVSIHYENRSECSKAGSLTSAFNSIVTQLQK